MIIIDINLTLVAFIALPIGAIILGVTIYFFMRTRSSLRETLEATKTSASLFHKKEKLPPQESTDFSRWMEKFSIKKKQPVLAPEETIIGKKKISFTQESIVQELKETIAKQQQVLNVYLDKVEEMEHGGKGELRQQNNDLQKEITKLHGVIEKKDEEIEDLQLQASGADKLNGKIEEVYEEFDQLQMKMMQLEKQANRANTLAMELDDTKQAYEQVYKELNRKQEKLEEMMHDNQRMRIEMETLEDKLSEANLQRQQLQKKVQFLHEVNAEMHSLSETNKKLQTELRRIGELESMLNMMSQERDFLLRKKLDK
jgi:chromosome segregation ATPase